MKDEVNQKAAHLLFIFVVTYLLACTDFSSGLRIKSTAQATDNAVTKDHQLELRSISEETADSRDSVSVAPDSSAYSAWKNQRSMDKMLGVKVVSTTHSISVVNAISPRNTLRVQMKR